VAGRDAERLRFVSKTEPLKPGTTSLRLFCPVSDDPALFSENVHRVALAKTSSSGTYVLDSSEARMSHLLFHWNHRKTRRPLRWPKGPAETLVRIPQDLRALDVRLRRPHLSQSFVSLSSTYITYLSTVQLGTSPQLLVEIHTCRNHLKTATIKLSGPTGIHFRYKATTLQGGGELTPEYQPPSSVEADCLRSGMASSRRRLHPVGRRPR
jgi:hypothetical protein